MSKVSAKPDFGERAKSGFICAHDSKEDIKALLEKILQTKLKIRGKNVVKISMGFLVINYFV